MKSSQLLYLDANIFIYYFQAHSQYGIQVKKIFDTLSSNKARAVTSVITQVELLSLTSDDRDLKHFHMLFLEVPHLQVEDATTEIALKAAEIRRNYGFRTPDAVHLATAVITKADVFITNDKRLAKFKEIQIKTLL